MNNHEQNEFSHWRVQRELRDYLSTIEPRHVTPNAVWYLAGALCAVLILITMVVV